MTHIDLFSGIGGFALAARWNGLETVCFCEIDEYPRRVLKKHWPDVPQIKDIHDFDGTAHRGATLLTGGFPCQPYSVAGKRGGKEDDRALWPEMVRVIKEARPDWVIAENVPGILTMEFDGYLADLENIGYEVQPLTIPACAVDAPHRRERVWIVANSNGGRLSEPSICQKQSGRTKVERTSEDVGNSNDSGRKEQRRTEPIEQEHPSPERCCRWLPEPGVGRVADGIPTTLDETLRDYGSNNEHHSETLAKVDQLRGQVLRDMWNEQTETEPPSLREKGRINNDTLHPLSHGYSHERWKLGCRIKAEPDLLDMWGRISSEGFAQSQDLLTKMLERIREIERDEKVASSRVNRLKGLGNAIVPQVAAELIRMILQVDYENS